MISGGGGGLSGHNIENNAKINQSYTKSKFAIFLS